MSHEHKPFIPASTSLPEITVKTLLLAVLLAVILAMSNAYLALKVGILTSASIPAAIISMGLLRFFKDSNILQNNLVQTCASSGEAVAGGIVYTIPALVIIHYWHHFPYWQNFLIALIGGVLGVLFSIPIRRVLVKQQRLRFPEGRAIAEVLKVGEGHHSGLANVVTGGIVGAVLELAQSGFKIFASKVQWWFASGHVILGFGGGFSATLLGAGYLIGFEVGLSLLVGAIIGWGILVPIMSLQYVTLEMALSAKSLSAVVMTLWESQIRYIGIGAMLVAGIWTLITLLKPFYESLKEALQSMRQDKTSHTIRTERDIPLPVVISGVVLMAVGTFLFFYFTIDLQALKLTAGMESGLLKRTKKRLATIMRMAITTPKPIISQGKL